MDHDHEDGDIYDMIAGRDREAKVQGGARNKVRLSINGVHRVVC